MKKALRKRMYSFLLKRGGIRFANYSYIKRNISLPDAWLEFPLYFIHVPKSAGTSICAALNMPDSGHLLFGEMRKNTAKLLAKKRCFIVVRNPLARLLSTYKYAKMALNHNSVNTSCSFAEYPTFESFLEGLIYSEEMLHHYFIRPASDFYNSAVSFGAIVDVIRFEDINAILPKYLGVHGVEIGALPYKNVGTGEVGLEKVSPRIQAKILKLYHDDEVLRKKAIATC